MTPRNLHQQPLYLEPADAEDLDRLAAEAGMTKQGLLREAVTDLLLKYRLKGYLHPRPAKGEFNSEQMRRELAREVRAGALINIEALVKSGDLIPTKKRNWYAIRDTSVLSKVSQVVDQFEQSKDMGTVIRISPVAVKRYKNLAARLKPGY